MAGDRPRQSANEISAFNVDFSSSSLDSPRFKDASTDSYPPKKWIF